MRAMKLYVVIVGLALLMGGCGIEEDLGPPLEKEPPTPRGGPIASQGEEPGEDESGKHERPAREGDTVRVHYTGKRDDGTEFDSSAGGEPLKFTIGMGQVIPGFEEAVIGMKPGESKTVEIPVDKAYGPRDEELVMEVEREKLPPEVKVEVGESFQMRQEGGRTVKFKITDVSESTVTLDGNHALAGKDLTFEIELVEIL